MSWLLFIIYFFILIFFIRKLNLDNYKIINHHHICIIFIIKIFVGISLNIFYTKYYQNRKTADIYKYFNDSKFIHKSLITNPLGFFQLITGINDDDPQLQTFTDSTLNWKYQTSEFSNLTNSSRVTFSNNRTITKFNAVLRIFSFGNINIHVLFMAFISLIGCILIFKAYYSFIPLNNLSFYIPIIFLTPTILIWSSGLLKEGLIIFGFGLFVYSLFKFSNNYFKYLLLIFIALLIIFITKYYLVFIMIPLAFIYLIPFKSNRLILMKYFLFIFCFCLIFHNSEKFNDLIINQLNTKRFEQVRTSIGGYYYLQFNNNDFQRMVRFGNRLEFNNNSDSSNLISTKIGVKYQVLNQDLTIDNFVTNGQYRYYFLDNFKKAGSYYSLPKLGNTIPLFLKSMIIAVFNVFIKPMNFLHGSLASRLASLENFTVLLFIMILIIKKRIIFNNLNVLLFNLIFIIMLYSVIGITTPVIGSLIRYKMIAFLLFLISLSMIFFKKKLKNNGS